MTYAKDTNVSTDKSQAEIQRTLQRYGAESFMHAWDREKAMIAFKMGNRQIRFILPMPDKQSRQFTHTEARGTLRSPEQAHAQWEKACRQKWRALALVIKAKLEAVESGIAHFEDEFMANILLPGGGTVGQFMLPQIEAAYESGTVPQMLPDMS